MKRVKIITDSTAYLSVEFIKKHDITVIPLHYTFEGEHFREGVEESFDAFFKRFESSSDFPVTSQPSVGAFQTAYEEAFKEYDQILVLTISSKLSGTYNSATLAKQLVDREDIFIVDSMTVASNVRFMIEKAIQLLNQDHSVEEVVEKIEAMIDHTNLILIADNLEYLKRGGRISGFASSIGQWLGIKPIIVLKDGKLELAKKVRGMKKAIESAIQMVDPKSTEIAICHIMNPEVAELLVERLTQRCPEANIQIDFLGPVIGAHIGPQAFGIFSLK